MSGIQDYDTDDQTVAIPGRGWLPLSQVFSEVQSGRLDAKTLPDYPVEGKGWFRADKAWEIISKR
jgi:hypothetical protein